VILNTCLLLHFSLGHELYKTLRGVRVQAYWELNEDIADESVLPHIAQRYSVALPPVFDDSIKDQLHQNTIRLATMGALGVPCFIVNEHLYWGQVSLKFYFKSFAEWMWGPNSYGYMD
jgi:2-hydroxychromene-2-carboxylate isomerase